MGLGVPACHAVGALPEGAEEVTVFSDIGGLQRHVLSHIMEESASLSKKAAGGSFLNEHKQL